MDLQDQLVVELIRVIRYLIAGAIVKDLLLPE